MTAVMTGRVDDIIDAMLTRSGGAILRAPADADAGEYDSWRQAFSRRDIRRLVGAGLIGPAGWAADRLVGMVDGCDLNPDELVTWWCTEGLRGLDQRAAVRSSVDWSASTRPADDPPHIDANDRLARLVALEVVPEWWTAWCERTVHGPKLEALILLGAERWLDEPAPPVPAKWYPPLVAKFNRRCIRDGADNERETPS